MKRLVWLLLAAFCTAIAQVQPADLPPTKAAHCDCCPDDADACGMPDCGLPPVAPTSGLVLQTPAPSSRAVAKQENRAPRFALDFLRVAAVTRATAFRPMRAPTAPPPASVPRFQAHCSFLI